MKVTPKLDYCTQANSGPKVSVIVPVFNVQQFLSKCLKSIINQTIADIEIICINDGSTDNSLKILEKFAAKDNRIRIISQENQGLSVARNVGINNANGEYLGFVDSDDWIDKKYFEELYMAAKLYNCDIACSSIKRLGFAHNSYNLFYSKIILASDIQEKIDISGVPSRNYVWNKIYRRDKFIDLNIMFTPGIYFEDIDWSIRVISGLGSLVTVPDVKYYYRLRLGSIVSTSKNSPQKKDDFNSALAACIKYANQHKIKLDFRAAYPQKNVYTFLGITVLKVYKYSNTITRYKLFGFIPLLSVYNK